MMKRLLASTALALVLTLPALAQTSTTTTTDTQNQTTTVPSASQSGTSTDTSQSATQSGQSTTGSTAQPSTTGGATTGSTTAQTGESSGSSSSMSSSTGQTAAGEEAIISQQQPGQVRADKVIGAKVTNPEEEKVGDVSDILLDEQGKVVGVILSVGGFLGIGDKHVAVNWNDIKLEDDGEKVVVNMTKDQITKAPSFKTAEDIKSEQQAQMPASSTSGTSIPSTTGTSTTGTSTTGTSTTQ